MTYTKLADAKIIDYKSGEEIITDLGIEDARIKKIGSVPDSKADKIIKVNRKILAPFLIDLHTHVYHLGTSLGIDAADLGQRSGVDIFVDAGSAGAGNFLGFRKYVIEKSHAKIYSFLNIGFAGIPFFGIGKASQTSEIPNLVVADENKCLNCIRENKDLIVGIKVRLSEKANGEHGIEPLLAAKRVAKKLRIPVMVHIGRPPPNVSEILPILENGDIMTHAFRPEPNSITMKDETGIQETAKEARRRGVLIDIGHGNGSFSFKVAKAAVDDGFLPDTISTDVHKWSVPYPAYDLPTTMSKMLNLGMPLNEVILSVTRNPAQAIKKISEHGIIEVGRSADFVVLDLEDREVTTYDVSNQKLVLNKIFRPSIRISKGKPSKIDYQPFKRLSS